MSAEPTHLYRWYGEGDTLLYVGISRSALKRAMEHATEKDWWLGVTHSTVKLYPSRSAALKAEEEAIKSERPRHNIVHNRPHIVCTGGVRVAKWKKWSVEEAVCYLINTIEVLEQELTDGDQRELKAWVEQHALGDQLFDFTSEDPNDPGLPYFVKWWNEQGDTGFEGGVCDYDPAYVTNTNDWKLFLEHGMPKDKDRLGGYGLKAWLWHQALLRAYWEAYEHEQAWLQGSVPEPAEKGFLDWDMTQLVIDDAVQYVYSEEDKTYGKRMEIKERCRTWIRLVGHGMDERFSTADPDIRILDEKTVRVL